MVFFLSKQLKCLFIILLGLIFSFDANSDVNRISSETLAVLVNDNDELSRKVADYYIKSRFIPEKNVVHVSFNMNGAVLDVPTFNRIKKQVDDAVSENIQAFVLTWSEPYRVDCMSITSAFAFGYSKDYCAVGCMMTKKSVYFNSLSHHPYKDHGVRPTIMLAAYDYEGVKSLIDRGMEADSAKYKGVAYLLNTSDKDRNVRAELYPNVYKAFNSILDVRIVNKDYIEFQDGVLFYFTGIKNVNKVERNNYYPGAIADHLTSTGGMLFDNKQMSILEWIRSGVTGTYGAVVEPCNFVEKFPNPGIAIMHYLNGDTLLEAYWKSVLMPGQGIFIGEPLATPFKGCKIKVNSKGEFEFTHQKLSNYVMRSNTQCYQ